jgi:hypothetical protein
MSDKLVISVSTDDPALIRQLQGRLEEYAEVETPKNYADPATVLLVLTAAGAAVTMAKNVADILVTLRSFKKEQEAKGSTINIFNIGVAGGEQRPIEETDADVLRRLLEQDTPAI